MKKNIFLVCFLLISIAGISQTIQLRAGFYPNGQLGKIYNDTVYTLPRTTLKYWNGYGGWGSFLDTARTAISLTTTGTSGAATYNSTTGVFNIPQYAGTTYTATTPITLTGSAFGMVNQGTTTTVLHGNAAGNPSFGSIVNADITNSTIDLTTKVTGALPTANAGTNITTYTTGDILYASATNVLSKLAIGSSTNVLTVTGGVPVWAAASGGGWGLTGNAGTTAGTNFLGTTDNVNLIFRRNNVPASILDSSSSGAGITGFGVQSLISNTANNSTAFGFKALNANTSGLSNVAFGSRAGLLISGAGARNTAIGTESLKAATTALDNTGVGYNTLTLSTGGTSTAVGSSALAGQTTGTGNTAVGYSSMSTATDGINNTAVGNSSGANLKGFGNVAIGFGSLNGAAVSGNTNIAIGYSTTLNLNTSGTSNIAIGRDAMATNTTTSNSTAVGLSALNLSTGGANTAFGRSAGAYLTTETGVLVLNGLDRANKAGDQTASPFYSQQTALAANITTLNGKIGLNHLSPTAYLHLTRGTTVASSAPLKFDVPTVSLATTAASGTGAIATLTFAAQTEPPFAVGSTIVIAGVTPGTYNTTATVTAVSTTTVSYTSTSTGAQTVAGTIAQGALMTTIEAGAEEYNGGLYSSTAALNRYANGGIIADFTADGNNTSTTETDLQTYTTKASTLSATGEKLVYEAAGTFNDLTATAQVQFYFGGTNIGNTGALTVSATGGWYAKIIIIRTGASTARSVVTISTPGASTAQYTTETDITGLTFTNTNIIKITGTAGGASGGSSDITSKLGTIFWYGASNN